MYLRRHTCDGGACGRTNSHASAQCSPSNRCNVVSENESENNSLELQHYTLLFNDILLLMGAV